MKFCEAMDLLKSGKRVTRDDWKDGLYFAMEGGKVNSYQPVAGHYQYNEDIMISDGWMIDDDMREFSFYEILPFLQNGSKAKMKDWKEAFIYLEPSEKVLVIKSMDIFPFTPQFNDFVAQDWIELV